jgi:ABC-2 type transport system ATP-binding protein
LVRGFDDAYIQSSYQELSKQMNLDKGTKLSEILSGGNKRKLGTALTLFSHPTISFYDEPTVGLDPVARRQLLKLIKSQGSSGLFTTHRLDEAEYLCDKIAIIIGGRLICIGSSDFLKRHYADSNFILL